MPSEQLSLHMRLPKQQAPLRHVSKVPQTRKSMPMRNPIWGEGLSILKTLMLQTDPGDDQHMRQLLGRLIDRAGGDCVGMTQVLHEAIEHRPSDPIPWLMACAHGLRVQNAALTTGDWGLPAWLAVQPTGWTLADVRGWDPDVWTLAMEASGIDATARPTLFRLGEWTRCGYRPDYFPAVMAHCVGIWREPAEKLGAFDQAIRMHCERWRE
jgi:hypothetical protein